MQFVPTLSYWTKYFTFQDFKTTVCRVVMLLSASQNPPVEIAQANEVSASQGLFKLSQECFSFLSRVATLTFNYYLTLYY